MNAIEILGSLLGNKSGGSGMGGAIRKEILKGGLRSGESAGGPPSGAQRPPAGRSQGRPRSAPTPSASDATPRGIDRSASELEDLLDVAREHSSHTPSAPSQQPPPRSPQPRPQRNRDDDYDSPTSRGRVPSANADQNDRALILVRAMVNAAKSDGRVSQTEQQNILNRLESASREAIEFLREEFARPLDVRDFAWSVPLGMEHQVYAMSLAAIDLDTNPEAQYLSELAHGLQISPDDCSEIHQRLGAPAIR